MSEVRAISFSQKDCGKHLSDSKKRFVWDFQIDGKHYTLQLVNSSLSGKRTIMLNMEQIYHQKNLLNIDFDFNHMIEGHSFRISRIEDSINKYELRIDNRTFDQVRLGKGKTNKTSSTLDFGKKSNDPFADFQSFASNNQPSKQVSTNNAFGDFDFDSFSKPSTPSIPNKVEQKPINTAVNNNSLLDKGFGESPKSQSIPVNDFQTNAFQTKSPNGFDDFLQSFKQNQSSLLDDQNQFATNAYVNRNHYLDLQGNSQQSDKYFGQGFVPQQPEEHKDKTIKQNFMQYNKMAGQAVKKAANTAAMKFNQIKKTFNESLI